MSLLPVVAWAGEPERYFPDDLQQDGRITLFPAFTPDGQTLYITQSEGSPIWNYPQRLKRSERTAAGWSAPDVVDFGEDARSDGGSVTPDGQRLFFAMEVECGGSDIVVSERVGDTWSSPRNPGCDVNSPAEEFGAPVARR